MKVSAPVTREDHVATIDSLVELDAFRCGVTDAGRMTESPLLFGFAFDRGAALWLYRYLDEVIVQSSSEWARGHAALTEQIRAAAGLVRA